MSLTIFHLSFVLKFSLDSPSLPFPPITRMVKSSHGRAHLLTLADDNPSLSPSLPPSPLSLPPSLSSSLPLSHPPTGPLSLFSPTPWPPRDWLFSLFLILTRLPCSSLPPSPSLSPPHFLLYCLPSSISMSLYVYAYS
jgi:hypothetical protein